MFFLSFIAINSLILVEFIFNPVVLSVRCMVGTIMSFFVSVSFFVFVFLLLFLLLLTNCVYRICLSVVLLPCSVFIVECNTLSDEWMDSRVSNSCRLRIIHLIYIRMYHKTRARTLTHAYYLVPFVTKIFLLGEPPAITIVLILKNSLESKGMRRGLLNYLKCAERLRQFVYWYNIVMFPNCDPHTFYYLLWLSPSLFPSIIILW